MILFAIVPYLGEEFAVYFSSALLFNRMRHRFICGLFAVFKTSLAFRSLNGLICGGGQIDLLYVLDCHRFPG